MEQELSRLVRSKLRGNDELPNQRNFSKPQAGKQSTTRWIFADEDNNKDFGSKNEAKNYKLQKIEKKQRNSESSKFLENRNNNPKMGSPERFSTPRRKFRRGMTPFSIRVRQKQQISINGFGSSFGKNNSESKNILG